MNIIEKLNKNSRVEDAKTEYEFDKEEKSRMENGLDKEEKTKVENESQTSTTYETREPNATQTEMSEPKNNTKDNSQVETIVIDKNFKDTTRLKLYIADIVSSVEEFLNPFDGWFKLRALIYKYGKVEVVTDGSIVDIDSLFNKIKASGNLSNEGIHLLNTDLASIKPLIVNGAIAFNIDEELASKATQVGMAIAERNNYLSRVATAQYSQVVDEDNYYEGEVSNDFETEMA